MTLSLSPERQAKLLAAVTYLSKQQRTTIRMTMRVLGLITSFIEALPWDRWHLRPLQLEILCQWNRNPDQLNKRCSLAPRARRSLKWWNTFEQETSMLTTDASLSGWVAHLNEVPVRGTWNAQEKCMSLTAVFTSTIKEVHDLSPFCTRREISWNGQKQISPTCQRYTYAGPSTWLPTG